MRIFSDHRLLSINTATLRKQGDLLAIFDACARHGIRGVSPWRDQVAAVGLASAARAVRDLGLELSGYCRGGMMTSDAARVQEARDDNRRAVDEAKELGAPCLVLVVGACRSSPGPAAPRTGTSTAPGRRSRSASPSSSSTPAASPWRWRSSRCTRCTPPTAAA